MLEDLMTAIDSWYELSRPREIHHPLPTQEGTLRAYGASGTLLWEQPHHTSHQVLPPHLKAVVMATVLVGPEGQVLRVWDPKRILPQELHVGSPIC
jgi:hypothetical protein